MKLTKTKLDKLIKEQMVKLTEADEVIDLAAAREEKEEEEEKQGLLEIARKLDDIENYMLAMLGILNKTKSEIEISKFYSAYRARFRGEVEAMDLIGTLMQQWVDEIYPRNLDAIEGREDLATASWIYAKEEGYLD